MFVDDEPNILSSIKRLFFDQQDFLIYTAANAQEGINVLAVKPVDVVVSDEKMPKVQGHQFIQYVKKTYPDVVRCILTGYADTESIIRAVNLGEVYRYLVKPWKDEELITVVRRAAEYGRMKKENSEMKESLRNQNKTLQTEVIKRTEYLEKALRTAKKIREEQDKLLDGIVTILSDVISHFKPGIGSYSKRVATSCDLIAGDLELEKDQMQRLHVAALLHEIGNAGNAGSGDTKSHIEFAERLLGKFESLAPVSEIIRLHHQNYDGSGYPGGVSGDAIPIEARILHVVSNYDILRFEKQIEVDAALELIANDISSKYDPRIVQSLRFIESKGTMKKSIGIPIQIKELKPGMILRDDLFMKNGNLCIPGNTEITKAMAEHLSHFMSQLDPEDTVYIRAAKVIDNQE